MPSRSQLMYNMYRESCLRSYHWPSQLPTSLTENNSREFEHSCGDSIANHSRLYDWSSCRYNVCDGLTCHNWPWWRHQMEILSALLALCAGNSPVTGEFPAQRPVTRSFDVFFDLRLKGLSKQSGGWWFETISRPLWRHCSNSSRISTRCNLLLSNTE